MWWGGEIIKYGVPGIPGVKAFQKYTCALGELKNTVSVGMLFMGLMWNIVVVEHKSECPEEFATESRRLDYFFGRHFFAKLFFFC